MINYYPQKIKKFHSGTKLGVPRKKRIYRSKETISKHGELQKLQRNQRGQKT
jgi:hypothetical protein